MKKNVVIIATMFLAASTAFAGMGGGGMGGGPTGDGSHGMPGRTGGQMPGQMGNGMNGMDLTVADDGTVFTIRRVADEADVPASNTVEVVAISPTGGTLWTWTSNGGVHQIEIAGNMVLVSSMDAELDHVPGEPQEGMENGSILYALAIHSGAELWQLPFDGRLMNLEPSANVIYAVAIDHDFETGTNTDIIPRGGMHDPGTGQGMGSAKLFAISLDGNVAWTVSLNE